MLHVRFLLCILMTLAASGGAGADDAFEKRVLTDEANVAAYHGLTVSDLLKCVDSDLVGGSMRHVHMSTLADGVVGLFLSKHGSDQIVFTLVEQPDNSAMIDSVRVNYRSLPETQVMKYVQQTFVLCELRR